MAAATDRWSRYLPLALVVLLYLVAIILIGPLREASFSDDWAYALTVQRFLETGQLRMHDWSASNAPLHIAWGALSSALLGYSFASLRLSTLALMPLGLIAFYQLAREHELSEGRAGLLTLVLLASPLVLGFSFTFMTDVPFLAYVTAGLFLYTRAIRTGSRALMIIASMAATAAVLTRQFGVAFVPGLLLLWLLAHDRRRLAPLFLAGIALPTLAAAWQAYAGAAHPNWAGTWVATRQLAYLRDITTLVPRTAWRVTVTLQYLALFCPPLLLPAVLDCAKSLFRHSAGRSTESRRSPDRLLVFIVVLFMVATTAYATLVLRAPLWPPLIPWNLEPTELWPMPARASFTLVAFVSGISFGRVLALRYVGDSPWLDLPLHERFLDTATLFLLGFQLFFFQFGDEYLLHLLPFTLIVVGRQLSPWLQRLRRPIVALSLGVLVLSTLWIRGTLAELEAQWRAGEDLVAAGVSPDLILSPTAEWHSYHGAFETYLAEGDHRQNASAYIDYSHHWLPARQRAAEYVIMRLPTRPKRAPVEVIKEIEYRDMWLTRRRVFVLKPNP